MVFEVASNGDADFIVTHNVRDFETAPTLSIQIATPSEILGKLRR